MTTIVLGDLVGCRVGNETMFVNCEPVSARKRQIFAFYKRFYTIARLYLRGVVL